VEKHGKSVGSLFPAKHFHEGRAEEPTTEVALRRGPAEDLYVVLVGQDPETQAATLKVRVNPLVNWIWAGVAVLLIGTVIGMLPERAIAFATARVPEGAATTTTAILLCLLYGAGTLHAQHIEPAKAAPIVSKSPVEKKLQGEIICMCGTCGRKRVGECTCGLAVEMRAEISALVESGKTYDEIIQHFVSKYGSQEVLAAPIDRGFNRLAWLLPYGAGLLGLAVIGRAAVRWSRRRSDQAASAPAAPAANPELERRLDDELRDLD
jgi:cytochrome c-type biogenesis protein CcmF